MSVERIPASEFKARCLALLDAVAETRAEYVVTKHGRPVARVAPLEERRPLEGSVRVLVDRDEDWFSTADLVDPPDDVETTRAGATGAGAAGAGDGD